MQDADVTDCRGFDEAAWLLLSDELDEDGRRAWERHVAGCDRCARLLAERRRALDVYDGLVPLPGGPLDLSRLPVGAVRRRAAQGTLTIVAAGLVLVVAGVLAGRLTARSGGDAATLADVQDRFRDLEVQLAVARIDQPTAAERLKAAASGVALARREPRIIESLLDALEADPSPNVRMAVVEALFDIDSTARVEERFERLLSAQPSPILQIALIELAADRRLVQTIDVLERVAAAPGDEAVRQRARWAVRVMARGV